MRSHQSPYSFGIGSNCSISPGFSFYCNTSAQPHQLLLRLSDLNHHRVVNITRTSIRIKNPIYTSRCTEDRFVPTNFTTINFTRSPYTMSNLNFVTQVCKIFIAL